MSPASNELPGFFICHTIYIFAEKDKATMSKYDGKICVEKIARDGGDGSAGAAVLHNDRHGDLGIVIRCVADKNGVVDLVIAELGGTGSYIKYELFFAASVYKQARHKHNKVKDNIKLHFFGGLEPENSCQCN